MAVERVPGADIVCPVAGAVEFVDSWGAPRSGGRRHQGVDMMSVHGTPVVAPVSGLVSYRSSRLVQRVQTSVAVVLFVAFGLMISGKASMDAVRELVKDFIHLDATRNIAGQLTRLDAGGRAFKAVAQAFATESGGYLTRNHMEIWADFCEQALGITREDLFTWVPPTETIASRYVTAWFLVHGAPEEAIAGMTVNAARALGLAHEVGTIEAGKQADLVAFDFRKAHLRPVINPLGNLVHVAQGGDVEIVMVAGQIVIEHGHPTLVDEERIRHDADRAAASLWERARAV